MKHPVLSLVLTAFSLCPQVHGQVLAQLRSARFDPPNMPNASTMPGGGTVLGNRFWLCDGLESFLPLDPIPSTNPDPVNSGLLFPDQAFALITFVPSCGQVANGGNGIAYLTDFTQPRGRGFFAGGVKRIQFTGSELIFQQDTIAANAGLAGDQPTALALGPDGSLYVGFLKNGNVKRILNPAVGTTQAVQSVGGSPNGRPLRALAFVGSDLYMATTQGLAVIADAISPTCLGGCNAVPVNDGFLNTRHDGLTSDSLGRVYTYVNGQVWRYTPSTGVRSEISIGGLDANGVLHNFLPVGGHTNLLAIDTLGNLWIGDDSSDGVANLDGRIWFISSAALAAIP